MVMCVCLRARPWWSWLLGRPAIYLYWPSLGVQVSVCVSVCVCAHISESVCTSSGCRHGISYIPAPATAETGMQRQTVGRPTVWAHLLQGFALYLYLCIHSHCQISLLLNQRRELDEATDAICVHVSAERACLQSLRLAVNVYLWCIRVFCVRVAAGDSSSAALLVAPGACGAVAALPQAADSATSNTDYNWDTHNFQNKRINTYEKDSGGLLISNCVYDYR